MEHIERALASLNVMRDRLMAMAAGRLRPDDAWVLEREAGRIGPLVSRAIRSRNSGAIRRHRSRTMRPGDAYRIIAEHQGISLSGLRDRLYPDELATARSRLNAGNKTRRLVNMLLATSAIQKDTIFKGNRMRVLVYAAVATSEAAE